MLGNPQWGKLTQVYQSTQVGIPPMEEIVYIGDTYITQLDWCMSCLIYQYRRVNYIRTVFKRHCYVTSLSYHGPFFL